MPTLRCSPLLQMPPVPYWHSILLCPCLSPVPVCLQGLCRLLSLLCHGQFFLAAGGGALPQFPAALVLLSMPPLPLGLWAAGLGWEVIRIRFSSFFFLHWLTAESGCNLLLQMSLMYPNSAVMGKSILQCSSLCQRSHFFWLKFTSSLFL